MNDNSAPALTTDAGYGLQKRLRSLITAQCSKDDCSGTKKRLESYAGVSRLDSQHDSYMLKVEV